MSDIHVISVNIPQQQRKIYKYIKNLYIKATHIIDKVSIRTTVLSSSVADPDPFGFDHFGQPNPDPGSKKFQNHGRFPQKSTKIIRISNIFFKTIKLMFTDINIYPINNKTDHISEKRIRGSGSISK